MSDFKTVSYNINFKVALTKPIVASSQQEILNAVGQAVKSTLEEFKVTHTSINCASVQED